MGRATQWEQGMGTQQASQSDRHQTNGGATETMLQWSTLRNALLALLVMVLLVRIMPSDSYQVFIGLSLSALWSVAVLIIRRYN